MHRLQELVRLHRLGSSVREVARLLQMSPTTERRYRLALIEAALLEGSADALPDASTLRAAVDAAMPPKPVAQQESSVEIWRDDVLKMQTERATPTAIYDCLRLQREDFTGSLSAIKRLCQRLRAEAGIDPNDVAIPVTTVAGEVAQVDFGSIGLRLDPETQKQRQAYVFVMVLGFSRHMFVRIVFDQKVETWLRLHVEAFEEWGGVPRVVVPDNLKSAVVRAAFGMRDEPELNRSYRELARHFGFKIDPTPAYSPEKKGKVESGVKYVKHNFIRPRNETMDVRVLSAELGRWVREVAGMRRHGSTHKRPIEVFEEVEKAALLPLPNSRWMPVFWRTPMLRNDCTALLSNARYSAPWRLVGKRLLARVNAASVELYFDDVRVATHERQPAGGESIKDEHLPPERGMFRHRQRDYWEQRAGEIGVEVRTFVNEVFDSDDVLNQLTKVQAIVGSLEKYPRERACAACRRASYFGSYTYRAVKNILLKGLDMIALPNVVVPASGESERPRFARSVQELLDLPLEKTDAPH